MITPDEAIRRALEAAAGLVDVPAGATPQVRTQSSPAPAAGERGSGCYVVTIPRSDPPGTRGPDYYLQVTVDADSGEVLEILGGS